MRKYMHPIIEEGAMTQVAQIMRSSQLSGFRGSPEGHLGGKYVRALEEAFCEYFNVKYAVALNSATAGLHVALVGCGIGRGDEVIVSPYTFSSSASCVLMVGAIPRFVDIDEDTFCVTSENAEEWLSAKAIIPVHLCGHPADMPLVAYWPMMVIEDAAQAIGAKYRGGYVGAIGDCGIFSFNQSKHISTGEGGVLITNDDYIARVARAMRNHGEVSDPELGIVGYNYRMCEIEAALALEQFKKLDEMNDWRIQLCEYMSQELGSIDGLTPPIVKPDCTHVYYTYAVKYDKDIMGIHRDEFQDRLIAKGVYFGKGYVKPLYLLPIYQQFGYKEGLCPVAERMWQDELMVTDIFRYPMTIKDCEEVVDKIKEVIYELQR